MCSWVEKAFKKSLLSKGALVLAPTILEDSNNDNKDIVKFVPGQQILVPGTRVWCSSLQYWLAQPRAKLLTNLYEDIFRAVKKVSISTPLPP